MQSLLIRSTTGRFSLHIRNDRVLGREKTTPHDQEYQIGAYPMPRIALTIE